MPVSQLELCCWKTEISLYEHGVTPAKLSYQRLTTLQVNIMDHLVRGKKAGGGGELQEQQG